MANTIQLKRSATAGKVPTTANLALGELAFNTNDGRLYGMRNAGSNEIVEFLSTNSARKTNVVAATTANVTVASAAPNTLDGVSLAANDRVLVKNQTAPAENGIYTVTTLGTGANGVWARATDCDTASDAAGAMVTVRAGTTQGGLTYTTSFKATDTLGTTAMNWTQLLSSAVSTISFGTTGLTPNSATSGAVTVAGTLVAANGGTGQTTARAAHAALNGAVLTVTSAAGTTTLDATSPKKIIVTGSTTQTIVLPVVTTLLLGWEYEILNLSTGVVTIQSSGLNTILSPTQSTSVKLTCILVTGTTAASWQAEFNGGNARTGVGNICYAFGPTINQLNLSTANAVTAGTNAQGQGALIDTINIVTTAANNPSGVTLPTPGGATVGRITTIVNRGANPLAVYPASGGTIDTLAANAAFTLPVGGIATFRNSSTTQWWSSASESFTSVTFDTTTGTRNFTVPPYGKFLLVRLWAGGGSGAAANTSQSGGGGGGSYKERIYRLSDLGAPGTTISYTIGAGGAAVTGTGIAGNVGGNSTFGSGGNLITAYGGGPGQPNNAPGSGGGYDAVGVAGGGSSGFGGTSGAGTDAAFPWSGANGGNSTVVNGGKALYGGGGGGAGNPSAATGGVSIFGGNGGAGATAANATAGAQPAGGGGGCQATFTSGKGGDGKAEFYVW